MRDLRNRVDERRGGSRAPRGDERDARAPRARLRRVRRRRRRARGPAALDHRPRDRRPADRERGRDRHRRPERRDLQLPGAARASSSARGIAFARTATPRCSLHVYEEHGDRFAERLRGHVRDRDLGRARAGGSCSRATASGSSRSTTAHADDELAFASELRALPRGEIDLDALEAFLAFNSVPAPSDDLPRGTRKLPPGHLLVWDDGALELRALRAAGADSRSCARTRRRSSSRSCARVCATPCARTSSATCPSACCSPAASTRALLAALAAEESAEPLRTFSIGFEERSFDELADARLVAERYGTRPPRARAAPRRGAALARARRRVRRAVRRLVGAADVPRVAARGGAT